ncbi:MAG: 3-oxoacyl-ACP synthase [Prevotella sp.]|nr:3-oxoacyl-ACP synthase [Prevotella sp.]
MTHILATNITSPLGMTTAENYQAVKSGCSALHRYEGQWGLSEPFTASLFTDEQQHALAIDGLTRFESLAVHSVSQALEQLPSLDITAKNVIFILSTTKANIELLLPGSADVSSALMQAGRLRSQVLPGEAAHNIATHLGFTTEPIVVCNACISGVAAIILAQRLLDGGHYDYAVVCGADVQNRFTVSGFQSLKAVSEDDCRPFDMERMGLNLGEAAATMVLSRMVNGQWSIENGLIRNDAFHISSPSKNGEGAWLALNAVVGAAPSTQHLAFINAHGTATMFNDQMESVAIERAGLSDIPVNGLKGYYGHTLGAAGILETIISLAALNDHTILATRGFEERGVSGKIKVTTNNSTTEKKSFVKMISGFGGGNAAITVTVDSHLPLDPRPSTFDLQCPTHRVTLTPTAAIVDGHPLPDPPTLTSLYKRYVGDYPKFYKMDGLSRLGFIASELLLQAEKAKTGNAQCSMVNGQCSIVNGQCSMVNGQCSMVNGQCSMVNASRAIVLFNQSSSIAADKKYLETIADDDFFPSPSIFVYTLPNIVTGEIAMRNGYHGETSFFILPERNEEMMQQIIKSTFQDKAVKSLITGWVDYYSDSDYGADLVIISNLQS